MGKSAVSESWWLYRWLPAFLLRKIYPPEKLSGLIHADLKSKYSRGLIVLGESSRFEFCFRMRNTAPFPVSLEQIHVRCCIVGVTFSFILKEKKHLPAGKDKSVCFSTQISETDMSALSLKAGELQLLVDIDAQLESHYQRFNFSSDSQAVVNLGVIDSPVARHLSSTD